ncbi:MAG: isoprenylcysteine carboxylmethyltransferase family protein [Steroidobacteraceae bacterium]
MEAKRRIIPPVWMLLALLASLALHRWLPLVSLLRPPWTWSGVVPILAALLLTPPAMLLFRGSGTPIMPFERSTALVTTGVYRFTRNPMYLGLTLVLLGAAVLQGSLGACLPIPLFVLIIQKRFIEGEERFLTEIFGEQYLSYRRRVRRWL